MESERDMKESAMSNILPTPWHVKETDRDGDFVQFEVRAANGNLVATPYYVTKDGAEVARLIAVAPKLLAMAQKLIWLSEAEENEVSDDQYEAVFDEVKADARAAIAEATGP